MQKKGRFLVAITIIASLVAGINQSAVAQGSGSYLVDALAAEVSGEDARIKVESIDAFFAEGSEAILEPGTDNEERFFYSAIDTATNELVGIIRENPIAHPAGSFIEETHVATVVAEPDTDSSETEPTDSHIHESSHLPVDNPAPSPTETITSEKVVASPPSTEENAAAIGLELGLMDEAPNPTDTPSSPRPLFASGSLLLFVSCAQASANAVMCSQNGGLDGLPTVR